MSSVWRDEIVTIALEVVIATTPLVLLFLASQAFLLKLPRREVTNILKGTAIAALGLFLFLVGVGVAFLPFGRAMGIVLGALDSRVLFACIGALLGFVTAWGEPAVRILADQVEGASKGSIRSAMVLHAVCAGVALWVALGMVRISYEIPLLYLLVPGYGLVIALMGFSSKEFVAIAADAGGVATGPLANSFLLALALGASSSIGSQDMLINGFGLVALVSLAPVMSVMVLGLFVRVKVRTGATATRG